MGWFYLLLSLSSSERWRKATSAEKQFYAGAFFFIPIPFTFLLVLQHFHSHILNIFDSGALTLWVAFTLGVSAALLAGVRWGKHVSARVSVVLGVFAWSVLLFLLFGLGLWDFGKP